jgi:predicted CXXCH cytochrome family protein
MNKFKFIAEETLDREMQHEIRVKKSKESACPRCKEELVFTPNGYWQCPNCLESFYECQECHAVHGAVKIIDMSGLKLCDFCHQEFISRLNEERAT